MTRENLIQAIYDNAEIWSCPNSDCGDKSAEEYKINDCIGCAEKLLSEYEQQIRADAIDEHFSKIMSFINTNNRGNSDYFIVDQIENYIAEQLKVKKND